jgi:uncharacterized OsmC-like protein
VKNSTIMRDRQRPLMRLYRQEPGAAWVVDSAVTGGALDDPLHGEVVIGPARKQRCPVALHSAVGGDSDAPVSGDILCAALASCLDTTIRAIANRLGLELARLAVTATAEVDVRGTLRVDDSVPVAFQRMTLDVDLELANGVADQARQLLLAASEYSCVVLQSLRNGVAVEVSMNPASSETELQPVASPACADAAAPVVRVVP